MSTPYRVGLDIGYGQTKIVGEDGRFLVFPTAITTQGQGSVRLPDLVGVQSGNPGYRFGNDSYEVASPAAIKRSIPPRSPDFLLRYAPILAHHAFKQFDRQPTHLCVGLALSQYAQHRAAFQHALERFTIDGQTYQQKVWVVPQGVGVLVDWLRDDTGAIRDENMSQTEGLILDIGYNTIDAVAFSGGQVDPHNTHMFDHEGISKVVDQLSVWIEREHGYRPSPQKAHAFFREQTLKVSGKTIPLNSKISSLLDRYFSELILLVKDRWGPKTAEFERILLAGGGTYYIDSYLPPELSRQVFYMKPRPEFSNARGFLKVLFTGQSQGQQRPLRVVGSDE